MSGYTHTHTHVYRTIYTCTEEDTNHMYKYTRHNMR